MFQLSTLDFQYNTMDWGNTESIIARCGSWIRVAHKFYAFAKAINGWSSSYFCLDTQLLIYCSHIL